MRKTFFLVAIAALLTFAFVTAAFADHSPSFYIAWSSGATNNSEGPHTDYSKTSSKCAVCHAAHRAPVQGTTYAGTTYADYPDGTDNAKGVRPAWSTTTADGTTQMLLRSSVSNACNYCHIASDVGGKRLYNGNVNNFTYQAGWTSGGFAHNTGCTGCHAVHGAKTFKGSIASKILRYDIVKAINPNSATITEQYYVDPLIGQVTSGIQDEIFIDGDGVNPSVTASMVALFSGDSIDNPIEGTNARTADVKNAQGAAFCTQCHANYSSASELVVNPDDDTALFSGFNFSAVQTQFGATFLYKNHPVKNAEAAFSAGGANTTSQVAWANADTCRACHDAGITDAAAGVVENSYPHFTPGYYMFMTSAADAGDKITPGAADKNTYANYVDVSTLTPVALGGAAANAAEEGGYEDGHCLKCHVRDGGTAGVNLTY